MLHLIQLPLTFSVVPPTPHYQHPRHLLLMLFQSTLYNMYLHHQQKKYYKHQGNRIKSFNKCRRICNFKWKGRKEERKRKKQERLEKRKEKDELTKKKAEEKSRKASQSQRQSKQSGKRLATLQSSNEVEISSLMTSNSSTTTTSEVGTSLSL